MSRRRPVNLAVDLNRGRLRAVEVSRRGGELHIRRALVVSVPTGLDVNDAQAMGGWMGDQLGAAGFKARRAVVALGREHAAVKQFTLPSREAEELPDMVRLAMQRDLPFAADDAVIDFIATDQTDASTTVMVVGAQRSDVERLRAIIRAAGLTLRGIALTTSGSAAVIAATERGSDLRTLTIDVSSGGLDYVVAEQGQARFSRAVGLTDVAEDDPAGLADALTRETQRTWMSYRIADSSAAIEQVVLTGDRDAIEHSSDEIGEMLDLPVGVLNHVHCVAEHDHQVDHVWPLVGLLLADGGQVRGINLASPRRSPDRAARLRVRVLAAAGLLLVIGLGLWTMGNMRLGYLADQVDAAAQQAAKLRPEYVEQSRRRLQLMHIERVLGVQPDALGHLEQIMAIAPPRDELVLSAFSATVDFDGVAYDRRARRWATPASLAIALDGEASERSVADAFRDALVGSDLYRAVSKGTDARGGRAWPAAFTYQLRSEVLAPRAQESAESRAAEGAGS